jgi:hypothetical protein
LTFGAIVSLLLFPTILRVHKKLDVLMKALNADPTHPIRFTNEEVDGRSVRWIIGWFIPAICAAALTVAAVFSWFGILSSN